ncbi:Pls/PosA family non-ribosomal peptide synthetase [Corynebacterium alimapuense]|uniref:Pls/PosA family non-ribosomal peptide synthetase n=1 Tax=Corynebacterium alimapuense TaxID=1576874 RepID=UPI0026C4EFC1
MHRPSSDPHSEISPQPFIPDHPQHAVFGVEAVSPPRTLVDILESTMLMHPDAIALRDGGSTLTYRQLRELLDIQATRLGKLGIGSGSRIGIRVPSGTTDLYVAILSTLWAGACYVPVDWDDPDSRAQIVWEEANVDAVYGSELSLTPYTNAQTIPALPQAPALSDDAWIIFTSGSTGKPKGVAITHRSAAALVDAESRMYLVDDPLGPGDRVMAGLSVAFDASCEEMWLAWRYGAELTAAPRDIVRSGDALGEWLIAHNISAVSTVPTLASLWPEEALKSVRLLIFGGEACPLDLVLRLNRPGREVWNTYGPTETTIIASGQLLTNTPPVRIGRPVPGWKLAVVDPAGQPVAWGESGELIIGGVGLGRYLDPIKDTETYAPLPALGWERAYRTGDLVRAEHQGLVFMGRADDQIKFGGRRLELGEIDDYLTKLPNVRVGAAALHKTPAGSDVLVGYLVAEPQATVDVALVRAQLAQTLPGGISPTLCLLEEMPLKTSGKVDRKALPWPLPANNTEGSSSELPAEMEWLAQRWIDQLGPVPLTPDSDFFDLGGSSVAVAKLVVELRRHHPGSNISELYQNRTLSEMHAYLCTLKTELSQRPMPAQIPRYAGFIQASMVTFLYLINGLKYVLGSLIVVWFLAVFADASWVPRPPWEPLLLGWILLFSLPGKLLQTALGVRLLTTRIRPGVYLRGGPTHLRVWAAERLLTFQRFDALNGSVVMPLLYRLLGNEVGKRCHLHSFPPVTGLLSIGDDVAVEAEVDLNGHWIDGDRFYIGTIDLSDGVRIGTRTLFDPDTIVGTQAEVLPGSYITGTIRAHQLCGGSPLQDWGESGQAWPVEKPSTTNLPGRTNRVEHHLLHLLGLGWIGILPILAILPGALLLLEQVRNIPIFVEVFPVLLLWSPLAVLLTVVVWLALVIATIRVLSTMVFPGFFQIQSVTGWAVWLIQALMERSLTSTYFIYASSFTPTFLRLLGARVGEGTEISTINTIPHLTWIKDRSFVADHALASVPRYRAGWVQVGTTVIGEGSFVGNSAIIGLDRDLPPDSLVAVLSSTPYHPERGTSWLGRRPVSIPRQKIASDHTITYDPPTKVKLARGAVELLRLLPALIAAWLDLIIVYVGTSIYMEGLFAAGPERGLLLATLFSGPIVLAAGIVASSIPIVAKWLLVGRFRSGEKRLFDTFIWRSELADNFAEPLAVPSLIRMSLGSPMFNLWARLMGTKIGRDVWCESWWLPEFDLISIADRSTVNRGTVLQTHLFHDRVMALEPVAMHHGSTLGPNSFLLPGSSIGERSTVGAASLVLRRDAIPADSVWQGNPVRRSQETHDLISGVPSTTNAVEKAV